MRAGLRVPRGLLWVEDRAMKYYIDFQHLRKGQSRPEDEGEVVGGEIDENGFGLLPSVGDYFQIDASPIKGHKFRGKVRSRLFTYFRSADSDSCFINVVIEETDDDWDKLAKE